MRTAILLLCLAALPGLAAARDIPPPSGAPCYLLTRTTGSILHIKTYEKKGKFYLVSDFGGKKLQYLASSVKDIEPLTSEECDSAEDSFFKAEQAEEARAEAKRAARSRARTDVRTEARITARSSARQRPSGMGYDGMNYGGMGGFGGGGFGGYGGGASFCGAPTRDGTPCMNRVAGGGYCHWHR